MLGGGCLTSGWHRGQTNETYGYSNRNQLTTYTTASSSGAYSYDPTGNLTGLPDGTTQAFDPADELTTATSPSAATTTYGYDTSGNRTSATSTSANVTYGYDQANRLTSYSSTASSTTAAYVYNGDGLRTSKTVTGSGAGTHGYVWDTADALPLLLYDGASYYLYGPGSQPIEQISGSGTPTYMHGDQQGSTRILTDSSADVVGTYTYSPYGATTSHAGTAMTALLYDGQYYDSESAFYYLQSRYYEPSTGQLLTRDPLLPLTKDPYGYVGGDPLNSADSSGLCNSNVFSGSFWTSGNCLSGLAGGPDGGGGESLGGVTKSVAGIVGAAAVTVGVIASSGTAAGVFAAGADAATGLVEVDGGFYFGVDTIPSNADLAAELAQNLAGVSSVATAIADCAGAANTSGYETCVWDALEAVIGYGAGTGPGGVWGALIGALAEWPSPFTSCAESR